MMGFFDKWEKGLAKTRAGILGRISGILRGKDRIDENALEDLERILIEGDIGVGTALKIINDVRERLSRGEEKLEEGVRDLLKREILQFVGQEGR